MMKQNAFFESIINGDNTEFLEEELFEANEVAIRIINNSKRYNVGLIGYYDDEFPDILRNTCNEEGKLIDLPGNRRVGDDIIAGTFYVCGSDDAGRKL